MAPCPCGSTQLLSNCCALIHADVSLAAQAEQLMRARYSAFVINNIDFIISTYHSSCNAEQDRDQICEAANIQWLKLDIIASSDSRDSTQTASVEFKAWFLENQQLQLIHERSRFIKETNPALKGWRYLEGTFLESNLCEQAAPSSCAKNTEQVTSNKTARNTRI
jgi:SEC-C motif-containing protein